jgi:hypothetical protein
MTSDTPLKKQGPILRRKIMDFLQSKNGRWAGVGVIAEHVGVSRFAIHRQLVALEAAAYVERKGATRGTVWRRKPTRVRHIPTVTELL